MVHIASLHCVDLHLCGFVVTKAHKLSAMLKSCSLGINKAREAAICLVAICISVRLHPHRRDRRGFGIDMARAAASVLFFVRFFVRRTSWRPELRHQYYLAGRHTKHYRAGAQLQGARRGAGGARHRPPHPPRLWPLLPRKVCPAQGALLLPSVVA